MMVRRASLPVHPPPVVHPFGQGMALPLGAVLRTPGCLMMQAATPKLKLPSGPPHILGRQRNPGTLVSGTAMAAAGVQARNGMLPLGPTLGGLHLRQATLLMLSSMLSLGALGPIG